MIGSFYGWPNANYGPPAVADLKNEYLGTSSRAEDDIDTSAPRSLDFGKRAYIIAYMHELKHVQTSTLRFFIASPDVCGEAASLVTGDLYH